MQCAEEQQFSAIYFPFGLRDILHPLTLKSGIIAETYNLASKAQEEFLSAPDSNPCAGAQTERKYT